MFTTFQLAKQLTKCFTPLSIASTALLGNIQAQRFFRNPGCGPPEPRCSKESIKKLIAEGCRKPMLKPTEIRTRPPYISRWINPECCNPPCPDVLPRFDDLYYKPSDKAKRVYRQTWRECLQKRIVRKFVCDKNNLKYPPFEPRPRKVRPKVSCDQMAKPLACYKMRNPKCIRICMPCCKGARCPPKCKRETRYLCKKVCTPYPSYSESNRPKVKPPPIRECSCLQVVPMCCAYEALRKRNNIRGGFVPL